MVMHDRSHSRLTLIVLYKVIEDLNVVFLCTFRPNNLGDFKVFSYERISTNLCHGQIWKRRRGILIHTVAGAGIGFPVPRSNGLSGPGPPVKILKGKDAVLLIESVDESRASGDGASEKSRREGSKVETHCKECVEFGFKE